MTDPERFFREVPRAETAVAAAPTAGWAYWRHAWTRRHTVAALIALPLLWTLNAGAARWPSEVGTLALLALIAAIGAVVLASFLPVAGSKALSGGVCALAPACGVFAATMMLNRMAIDPAYSWLSLGLIATAAALRYFGGGTCSTR
ncbi:MAG TPA: hypothetical protein PLL50_07310 [Propionicimonas sp.]|nr:hypothetical protein [Propionicimonas sp.]HQA78149.1 hypothetical protein [Propionicimonas sp.]HQD97967.1 hypothetical protein [Propionicimonas sp.]